MNPAPGVRPAHAADVPAILELVNAYAAAQLMLPRSPLAIYENLRDFVVVEDGGGIAGCGALHVVWGDLAEIRSIAVREDRKGAGLGRRIATALLDDAKRLRIPRVFAFTYVPQFFEKLGFRVVEHGELPHKVFGDCLNCPKFHACDETAVVLDLAPYPPALPERGPLSRPIPGLHQGPYPRPAGRSKGPGPDAAGDPEREQDREKR